MKIVSYSTKHYDSKHMDLINQDPRFQYDIEYFDFPLTQQTAKNAVGADAVCIFVNDDANLGSIAGTGRSQYQNPRTALRRF